MEPISVSSVPNAQFSLPEELACKMITVKGVIEDCNDDDDEEKAKNQVGPIPLPNVSAPMMALVVEHLKHPDERTEGLDDAGFRALPMSEWELQFFASLGSAQMIELMNACNYLDYKALLERTTKCLALRIKPLNPEQIKEMFGFKGEFTPEQIAKAEEDHPWLPKQTAAPAPAPEPAQA